MSLVVKLYNLMIMSPRRGHNRLFKKHFISNKRFAMTWMGSTNKSPMIIMNVYWTILA